jgi:SPP1 family phage portal protein
MEYKEYLDIFKKKRSYEKLFDYYKGYHDILKRRYKPSRPQNKLVNAFPSYITNVNVGYFLGKPIKYGGKDDVMIQAINDIMEYNDEHDENIVLARFASIAGTAYELLYVDEESNIRFNEVSPENMVMVYDDKIHPEPEYAIRCWENDRKVYLEVYDKEVKKYFVDGKLIEETQHFFKDVPAVEFPNNDDRIGDFEKVISLIDAYDNSQSNIANDFDYFSDAYLKLKNLSQTQPEDIEQMRMNRTLLVDGDGDAEWLLKNIQDSAHENFKNRLQEDIHRFSQTPNLTDDSFSGVATGVSLRYKILGLEWNCAVKERKFKRALQRRLELICTMLNTKGANYDWRDVKIIFSRNLPQNELEAVQIASMLKGVVSDRTLMGIIPYVDNPNEELEQIESEGAYTLEEPLDELQG